MLYVLFNQGQVVATTTESPWIGRPEMREIPGVTYDSAKTDPDYNSFAEVEDIANQLAALDGQSWIAYDNGSHTSHRYGVMTIPKIGDDVSYGFNGDYYPCGKITRITPSLRITATDERGNKKVFNRKRTTSSWVMVGGTWSLVKGIHDERNPSF